MWKAHLGEGIPLSFVAQLLIETPSRLAGMQNDFFIAPPLRERVGIVHEFAPKTLSLGILPHRQLAHLDTSFIQWLEHKAGHQFGSLPQGKVEGIILPGQFRRVVGKAKWFAQDLMTKGDRLLVCP